jgi:pimeloyl-ACP methyl ester carboxylesterase
MTNKIQILTLLLSIIFFGCNKDDQDVNIATISSLNCDNAKINGVLSSNTSEITQGIIVNNLELSINYSGGNGGQFSEINISSTGVTGLVASAPSGNLVNGSGSINLKINGTASSHGDAVFNMLLGGVSCSFKIKVQPTTVQATITNSSFTSSSSGNFGYWLYTPKNPTANMPLIVYLHGGSFRGTDINLLIGGSLPKFLYDSTVKDIPAYILMPQCPTGKTWEQITTPIIELIDNIAVAKSINSDKISLTGHSLGGSGTWKYGALYSNKFSCIAPLSGSVLLSAASQYANIPVYAFVGSADTIVDPNASINIVPAINSVGGQAQIKIYTGATHFDVPDLTYKDNTVNIFNWMITQTK